MINKLNFLFFFILISHSGFSQRDITLSHNNTASGRGLSFTYSQKLDKKNEWGIGITYHFNKLKMVDDQNNVFYKRFYATKTMEHFGIETFYHRYIKNANPNFEPFMFYDLQYKYGPTRGRDLTPYTYEEETGDILYKEYIHYWGRFHWVEQNVGLGFKAKIKDNLYLTQKVGAGVMLVITPKLPVTDIYDENSTLGLDHKVNREFGLLFQTGFIYRFE